MKTIISILLGTFVLVSIGLFTYKELRTASPTIQAQTKVPLDQRVINEKKWIDAYYFHTSQRCYSCTKMETYIKETLDDNFMSNMNSGDLKFQSVNVDQSKNRHYIDNYKLYTKSFVLSLKKSGKEYKWLNCNRIWDLVKNEEMFKKYIKLEVKKYLEIL